LFKKHAIKCSFRNRMKVRIYFYKKSFKNAITKKEIDALLKIISYTNIGDLYENILILNQIAKANQVLKKENLNQITLSERSFTDTMYRSNFNEFDYFKIRGKGYRNEILKKIFEQVKDTKDYMEDTLKLMLYSSVSKTQIISFNPEFFAHDSTSYSFKYYKTRGDKLNMEEKKISKTHLRKLRQVIIRFTHEKKNTIH